MYLYQAFDLRMKITERGSCNNPPPPPEREGLSNFSVMCQGDSQLVGARRKLISTEPLRGTDMGVAQVDFKP